MGFCVERKEAEAFSKVWNKSGVHILLTPEAVDFATDFSNVVLRNFIQMCQKEAEAKKPKIIVEGVN